jgi:hypothetical protein
MLKWLLALLRFGRKKVPRTLEVSVFDELTLHGSLAYKLKRQGEKRACVEGFTGDDLHRASGHWMRKVRIVNRKEDLYFEEIVHPETGEIVRRCEEPLSQHRGHGSAKKQGL